MSDGKQRRRRILIDSFQYRFVGITLLYFGAVVAILATALFLPLMIDLRGAALRDPGGTVAATEFLALHARFWPALGITFVLVVLHAVITSHRIAGPLYRFRATYREIAEGTLSERVSLRKNDYLGKDAHALNAMITSLRARIGDIRERHRHAVTLLGELGDALDERAGERTRHLLGRLCVEMEDLEDRLAAFHLEAPGSSPGESTASNGSGTAPGDPER